MGNKHGKIKTPCKNKSIQVSMTYFKAFALTGRFCLLHLTSTLRPSSGEATLSVCHSSRLATSHYR